MKLTDTVKLNVALALMVFLWASAYISIRVGLHGYSPGPMALFRYLIASVCMLIIYWRSSQFHRIKLSDLCSIAILGIIGFSLYNISLNYGEETVSAGMASFIISQIPVLITLFATIFFRNQLTLVAAGGTMISFLGILLIAIGKTKGFHLSVGVVEVFMATLCGSLYSLFQKRLLQRVHPIVFTSYAIWFGTLALMIYFPGLIHQIRHAPWPSTLVTIYNGIFPAAIAYLLWSFVSEKLSAIKAASFLYLVPIVSTIMDVTILHESPTALSIVGSLLTLMGAILVKKNKISWVKHSENQS